jgi:nucleoside-diphosphate-sugar epimerase
MPEYDDPRPGDVRHSGVDISKARDLQGSEPEVTFADGLERTVEVLTDRPVEAE